MIYQYRCTNNHEFDRYLPLEDYDQPQVCECGAKSKKIITSPRLVTCDFEPFQLPGKEVISSRKAWRNHLAKTDSIELCPSDIPYMQKKREEKFNNIGKDPERKYRIAAEFEKRRL